MRLERIRLSLYCVTSTALYFINLSAIGWISISYQQILQELLEKEESQRWVRAGVKRTSPSSACTESSSCARTFKERYWLSNEATTTASKEERSKARLRGTTSETAHVPLPFIVSSFRSVNIINGNYPYLSRKSRVDHIHFPMKEAALLTNLSTNISRKNALDGSFAPESTTRQQSKWITFALGIPHL